MGMVRAVTGLFRESEGMNMDRATEAVAMRGCRTPTRNLITAFMLLSLVQEAAGECNDGKCYMNVGEAKRVVQEAYTVWQKALSAAWAYRAVDNPNPEEQERLDAFANL